MKKFMKKSLFTLVFTLAFLFVGVVTVKAAAMENTTVSGYTSKYDADGETYYLIDGKAEEGSIKVKNIANGKYDGFPSTFKNYTATLSVVTCKEVKNGICNEWLLYTYNTDASKTMDALKKTMTLKFNSLEATKLTSINDVQFGTLKSFYGIENTYFVTIRYATQNALLYKGKSFTDTFNVVFSENIAELEASATLADNKYTITATSGANIASICYFASSEELSNGFEFDVKYAAAAEGSKGCVNGPVKAQNGKFTLQAQVNKEEGKYYYVKIVDESGDVELLDLDKGTSSSENNPNANNKGDSNVGDTEVGKFILIALLVVLVLSLVLVIVQRIVDYRKKLY